MAEFAEFLKRVLVLDTEPVAVFLVEAGADTESVRPFDRFERVDGHRYCQLLMRARHGESVLLQPEGLACPAAAAAFGFRPLPKALATGEGLVGFGIVSDPATGRTMFEGMPRLEPGRLVGLAACPLGAAPGHPDVVVLEGPPEALMWVALADLKLAKGERRLGDTAVLQGACVDATLIPFLRGKLNFSLGCYGCREATDLAPTEMMLGFPGSMLEGLTSSLEELSAKAIPRSRSKGVLASLLSRIGAVPQTPAP